VYSVYYTQAETSQLLESETVALVEVNLKVTQKSAEIMLFNRTYSTRLLISDL